MDLPALNARINDLVGSARTEEALQTLLQFLEKERAFPAYQRIARNLQAHWNRTRAQASQGMLTTEAAQVEFNRINDGLLLLVDQLAANQTNPTGFSDFTKKKNPTWPYLLLGGLVLLLGAGAWYFFLPENEPSACPGFPPESQLNILLLPFQNLAEGELRPEITIKERLDDLCDQKDLNTFSNIFARYYERPDAQFPDFDLAREIGSSCEAGLVVWGTAERLPDRIQMKAKFSFTGDATHFDLTKVQLEGETQIDTIQSVSSIAREGNLTKDIETLIFTLFGIIAHEKGDFKAAADALTQTSRGGDTSLLTSMLLADSYLAMGDHKKALAGFEKVLEVHPNYALALNNRGLLLYQQGEFRRAVGDFSQILQQQPENTSALIARGAAYAKLDDMQKAEKDLKEAKRIDPQIRIITIKEFTPSMRRNLEIQ